MRNRMSANRLPAVFMRGGTSKALMFHLRDLARGLFEGYVYT